MLNFTHVTKLLAIAIIMTASACSKKDINEPQQPAEKGHFSVQINNPVTKTLLGSTAENLTSNIYLFLYNASAGETAPCIVMQAFKPFEIANKKIVFSLPDSELTVAEKYTIYAMANLSPETIIELTKNSIDGPTKQEIGRASCRERV